jgi:hypothetical protein
MTREEANSRISEILRLYVEAKDPREFELLPQKVTAGKLYEAYALSLIAKQLVSSEGLQLMLMNGNYLPLKSSPGAINRKYPFIQLARTGRTPIAEMWTDIEFLSLSWASRPSSAPTKGEYHELDIAIVSPGLSGRPRHDQIWLGAECKNTGYEKSLLKEILGVRRELSLLTENQPTHFRSWPRTSVPCTPASCLLVYASDRGVAEYSRPGEVFGIDFNFEELAI